MRSSPWRQLIYYGEVVGFLLAWVVGLAVALDGRLGARSGQDTQSFASADGRAPGAVIGLDVQRR